MAGTRSIYSAIFGETPETKAAAQQRDASFQSWLNTRKKVAEQQRTSDVNMARYNALGNLLTTMVQPIGWVADGRNVATGGVQPYDDRQYIQAFNRAVKASDDLRNIGSSAQEYEFKLADENYRRQLALEDEARSRAQKQEDLEYKAQQRIAEIQQKFENDMAKINRQGEIRQEIAAFNASHKITSRSTGLSIDEREKLKLMGMYGDYRKNKESYNETPLSYADWLKEIGYSSSDNTARQTVVKPASVTATATNTNTNTATATNTSSPAAPAAGGPLIFKLQ